LFLENSGVISRLPPIINVSLDNFHSGIVLLQQHCPCCRRTVSPVGPILTKVHSYWKLVHHYHAVHGAACSNLWYWEGMAIYQRSIRMGK
jgi:hypothetical protein